MKINILNLTLEELEKYLEQHEIKKFVAKQIFDWIYKKDITNFDLMNNIKKTTIEWLKEQFYFTEFEIVKIQVSHDKTTKFLFRLADGNLIETVLMFFEYGNSICVTSQVGCNMGCKFCASGQLKKIRNLEAGEIINQLLMVNKYLKEHQLNKVRNIVVMGIGEPLDNYENLKKFINIARNDYATAIGSRKITVSSCGLINKFDDFINDFNQVGLAISLHAPNNEIRNKIMPINQAFNIHQLIDKCVTYTLKTNRRITFEYIMLKNINDSIDCAHQLADLLKVFKKELVSINLIPYNNVTGNEFQRSDDRQIRKFYETLRQYNYITTVRQEKGNDIDGACGQLRAKNLK